MNFEERKKVIEEVSGLIKLIPDALQEKAFDFLIADTVYKSNNVHENKEELEIPIDVAVKPRKLSQARKTASKASPQILKDLNLRPEGIMSLKDFYNEKKPSGNIQITTLIVYYLQNKLEIQDITASHVFTCYRELSIKIPGNLEQNLRDCASSNYGYITYKDGKSITSVQGINFVEHDLPKASKGKK